MPWGVNGEEMHMMLHLTHGADAIKFDDVVNVLRSATSKAGERLGLNPLLGTLAPGAPADIIAVRGNPLNASKSWNILIWSCRAEELFSINSESTTLVLVEKPTHFV